MAADLEDGVDVIAGTAWMFAREEFDQSLDYLIIDEAGQFSLANALAVGTAARNLVLLGDPLQLEQPSKGTHPHGAGASALGHVLGEARTLPDDLGIFLDHTHRLHPDICAFISEVVYEGRLRSTEGLRAADHRWHGGVRRLGAPLEAGRPHGLPGRVARGGRRGPGLLRTAPRAHLHRPARGRAARGARTHPGGGPLQRPGPTSEAGTASEVRRWGRWTSSRAARHRWSSAR